MKPTHQEIVDALQDSEDADQAHTDAAAKARAVPSSWTADEEPARAALRRAADRALATAQNARAAVDHAMRRAGYWTGDRPK